MKVEKRVYSSKIGEHLIVYLSEDDNVTGRDTPNTKIEATVITQEILKSERRIFIKEYWIQNNAHKLIGVLNKAIRDSENKFCLDTESIKMFELTTESYDVVQKGGELKINAHQMELKEKLHKLLNLGKGEVSVLIKDGEMFYSSKSINIL